MIIYHENKVLVVDIANTASEIPEYVNFNSYFKFRQSFGHMKFFR